MRRFALAAILVGGGAALAGPDTLGLRGKNYGIIESLHRGLRFFGFATGEEETGPNFLLAPNGATGSALSGWSKLGDNLTINSTAMTLVLSCDLDAAASGSLVCDSGETLTETGAGALTENVVGPWHDEGQGVQGDETNYYLAAATTVADLTTVDFVTEMLFRYPDAVPSTTTDMMAVKWTGSAGVIHGQLMTDGTIRCVHMDDGGAANVSVVSTGTFAGRETVHMMSFVNRDDSTEGAICYFNGAEDGTADPSAHAGTLTNADSLTLLGREEGAQAAAVLYGFRIWSCAGCLQATKTEQAAIAAERSSKVFGQYPTLTSATTDAPDLMTRASATFCDVYNSAGTIINYHLVGDAGMCPPRAQDSNGVTVTGYQPFPAATNLLLQSQEYDATWTATRVTVDDQALAAPDGTTTADGVAEDGTASTTHHLAQTPSGRTGDTDYLYGVIGTPDNRDWILLFSSDGSIGNYFNLSTCAAGGTCSGCSAPTQAFAIDLGNSYCLAAFQDTSISVPTSGVNVFIAESDGDHTFSGLTQNSVYLWESFYFEGIHSPKQPPVTTTTVAASRAADVLRFKADDGLIDNTTAQGSVRFGVLCPNYDNASELHLLNISDGGAATDMIDIFVGTDDNIDLVTAAAAASGGASTLTDDITDGVVHWIEAGWRANNAWIAVDGVLGTVDTDVGVPDDLDQLHIGADEAAASQPGCVVFDLSVNNKAVNF